MSDGAVSNTDFERISRKKAFHLAKIQFNPDPLHRAL